MAANMASKTQKYVGSISQFKCQLLWKISNRFQ